MISCSRKGERMGNNEPMICMCTTSRRAELAGPGRIYNLQYLNVAFNASADERRRADSSSASPTVQIGE